MSIIMPAGNKKVDWSPKEEKVVKTASVQGEVKEEVNALYEAAKLVVEAAKKCDKCGKKVDKDGKCECKEEKKEEKKEASAETKVEEKKEACVETPKADASAKDTPPVMKDEKKDVVEVGVPKNDEVIVEPVSEEKEEVSKTEAAVGKIEEAVIELKEVVQEEKGETGGVDEVEIEVEDGIPGEEVSNSEIIVQSEPGKCDGSGKAMETFMSADKSKTEKTASTEEEFCRFAKLSPANKAKLANYWTNMLGYPKDWVDLLTKDYEK